ncbi:MAG: site-specific integrase [Bacteroides sp.]|nr:site-specific integrase [Roseburia sp.]MCM1345859.1 site-specific integrase [Bacteroides sp.]MCM1420249.1 site-specific integrase [Bacteroides sp.]
MATVKIKFRPSSVAGKEGSVYYQLLHNRATRYMKIGYKIFPDEWDDVKCNILLPDSPNTERDIYLCGLNGKIAKDMRKLHKIIDYFESKGKTYTVNDIIRSFSDSSNEMFLFPFMQEVIKNLENSGKERTSEAYISTLNSFMRFVGDRDVMFDDFDSDLMQAYEAFLRKEEQVGLNTSSFYMRVMRAVYNRAVEKGITVQRNPFRHVYTGVSKTVKRAIPLDVVRKIKLLDLTRFPNLDYARDIFMFSFYTRGMAFVDMTYLKKTDLKNGVLSYRRQKTGQQLFIKWEPCMQGILDKYSHVETKYLLPIIKVTDDERKQYKNVSHFVNCKLKRIGRMVGLSIPLTMYVARHSWASIAKSKNIPISVISEGMGHDSERTTMIYLTSLDTHLVDNANRIILSGL